MAPGETTIFGIVGWSGSGKTTLMLDLLPDLIERGYQISTMKHTHHNFDMDKPGKDSFQHREAGAHQVLITGSKRWALLHENRNEPEPDIETLLSTMAPVDLVLIEGFKNHPHRKLEVFRPSVGKPLLATDDQSIVAVLSDQPIENLSLPVLDLNNIPAVGDFIVDFCRLDKRHQDGSTNR